MLNLAIILSTGADGRWHPSIGDPTPLGWLTVVAYFAAAVAAFRASARSNASARESLRGSTAYKDARIVAHFWAGVALCMLLLGVNKQLDLQTFFTETMRDLARTQGWYADRRRYQIAFIAAIAVSGGLGLSFLLYALRRVMRQVLAGAIGLLLITVFVLVRAASFHHVDMLLGFGTIRLNWVLELSGISVVLFSAQRAKQYFAPRVRQDEAA